MNTTIGRPVAKAVRANGDVAAKARPIVAKERLVIIMPVNMGQGGDRRKRPSPACDS
jgi:hypothetical protein